MQPNNPQQDLSIEQQIAMHKMQKQLDKAKERMSDAGYQPLEVTMTPNGPLAYGVKYDLASNDDPGVEIAYTPLTDEEDAPVALSSVQLGLSGVDEETGIHQLVLMGIGNAEGASVLETAAVIQEAQLAQQIGIELTMLMAAHSEGQLPKEALDNTKPAPVDPKTTPGGIILP